MCAVFVPSFEIRESAYFFPSPAFDLRILSNLKLDAHSNPFQNHVILSFTATIAATPADKELQVAQDEVPGVKVGRRIAKTRQLSPVTTEYTIEFTLTNSSKIAQSVEIVEQLPLNPKVGEASPQPVVNETARTLSYSVVVAPEDSVVLRYFVESKTG